MYATSYLIYLILRINIVLKNVHYMNVILKVIL